MRSIILMPVLAWIKKSNGVQGNTEQGVLLIKPTIVNVFVSSIGKFFKDDVEKQFAWPALCMACTMLL
jgi:chromate transport protein ChrA